MARRGGGRLAGTIGVAALMWSASASAAPVPAPAPAADPNPTDSPAVQARRIFEEGSEAYNLGDFALAIDRFEAAYELTGAVELLYNIAMAYTRRYSLDAEVDHLRRSRLLFENFASIREANGEDIRDARVRVAQLDAQLAAIEAAQRTAEQQEAQRLAAAEQGAARRDRERSDGERRVAPPVVPRYRPGTPGIVGYAGLGVGLLAGAGVATAGFVGAARLQGQRADEAAGLSLPAAREALYARHIGEARTLGLVGVGVGAAIIATAVALIVVDARRGRATGRRAALGPWALSIAF